VVSCVPRDNADGLYVEVALSDDFRMWGVLGSKDAPSPGASVLACTRKEHVAVVKRAGAAPCPDVASPPDEQMFGGVMRAASFLGLEEEYLIAIDGIELGAIQPPRGLHAGEPITVTIRTEDCIVFVDDDPKV
jgi:hypothetical protein